MRYFIEGCTDLYRLGNGTLTGIRYQDEMVVPGPTVRPYTGAVGHESAWPHVQPVPGASFFFPLICRVQVLGEQHGGEVALLPYSKKVPGLNLPSDWGHSVWCLHVLPMSTWVLWLLPTVQWHVVSRVRLICDFRLSDWMIVFFSVMTEIWSFLFSKCTFNFFEQYIKTVLCTVFLSPPQFHAELAFFQCCFCVDGKLHSNCKAKHISCYPYVTQQWTAGEERKREGEAEPQWHVQKQVTITEMAVRKLYINLLPQQWRAQCWRLSFTGSPVTSLHGISYNTSKRRQWT